VGADQRLVSAFAKQRPPSDPPATFFEQGPPGSLACDQRETPAVEQWLSRSMQRIAEAMTIIHSRASAVFV